MRVLVKVSIPNETGNARVLDGTLSQTLESILGELKPEAAYFIAENGVRTGILICNLAQESDIPALAEPLFLALNARVEVHPCMVLADLKKAAASFEACVRKYGPR